MAEDNKELTGLAKVNAERKAAKAAKEAEEKAKQSAGTGNTPDAVTPPAGDPPGGDPSPEFRGKAPGDIPPPAPQAIDADPEDENDPAVKLAKEYAKLYPKNKTFYITSDRQVFLEDGRSLALLHQRSHEGIVKTVNVE